MEEQRQRAREAGQFGTDYNSLIKVDGTLSSAVIARQKVRALSLAMFVEGNEVDSLSAGDKAIVVLDETPFYAESGGQCGDTGVLKLESGLFKSKILRNQGNAFAHHGCSLKAYLLKAIKFHAVVDAKTSSSNFS